MRLSGLFVYSFREHGFCVHLNLLSILALGGAQRILKAFTELDHVAV